MPVGGAILAGRTSTVFAFALVSRAFVISVADILTFWTTRTHLVSIRRAFGAFGGFPVGVTHTDIQLARSIITFVVAIITGFTPDTTVRRTGSTRGLGATRACALVARTRIVGVQEVAVITRRTFSSARSVTVSALDRSTIATRAILNTHIVGVLEVAVVTGRAFNSARSVTGGALGRSTIATRALQNTHIVGVLEVGVITRRAFSIALLLAVRAHCRITILARAFVFLTFLIFGK